MGLQHEYLSGLRLPDIQHGRRSPTTKVVSKTIKPLFSCFAWIILLSGLLCLGMFFAGYQFISARGDSMEPTSSSGSLLITRTTAPENINEGDIIAFPGPSEDVPLVAHRVVTLINYQDRILAVTKGDNNQTADPGILTIDKPVSRVSFVIPYLGWLLFPGIQWYVFGIGAVFVLRATVYRIGRRHTLGSQTTPNELLTSTSL